MLNKINVILGVIVFIGILLFATILIYSKIKVNQSQEELNRLKIEEIKKVENLIKKLELKEM